MNERGSETVVNVGAKRVLIDNVGAWLKPLKVLAGGMDVKIFEQVSVDDVKDDGVYFESMRRRRNI